MSPCMQKAIENGSLILSEVDQEEDAVTQVRVLQCVAVCCSVLKCVAVCVAVSCRVLQGVAVCCSVLQCVLL